MFFLWKRIALPHTPIFFLGSEWWILWEDGFFPPSKCNTHSFLEEIRKAPKTTFPLPFVIVAEIWFSAFCEVWTKIIGVQKLFFKQRGHRQQQLRFFFKQLGTHHLPKNTKKKETHEKNNREKHHTHPVFFLVGDFRGVISGRWFPSRILCPGCSQRCGQATRGASEKLWGTKSQGAVWVGGEFFHGNLMVNSPLIRPYIYWGGGTLDSHEFSLNWATKKSGYPGWLVFFWGDDDVIAQLYRDYFINHCKDPY